MPKLRVVVLASGTGTLFEALANQASQIGIEIIGLITDSEVAAGDRAVSLNIPVSVIQMQDDRALWDHNLVTEITRLSPDLVVSAGFMKILGPKVLQLYSGRIINTHPALLPQFPGAHAVRDAISAGATVTGATVHFVDAGVDTGPIIAQQRVMVEPDDTEAQLHERIKVTERELLINVVADIVKGNIEFGEVVQN